MTAFADTTSSAIEIGHVEAELVEEIFVVVFLTVVLIVLALRFLWFHFNIAKLDGAAVVGLLIW